MGARGYVGRGRAAVRTGFIDDLAAKGLHTLFDVVTRRHEQLVVELGLEETAARRLLDVCYARSDAWEKENGGTIYVR